MPPELRLTSGVAQSQYGNIESQMDLLYNNLNGEGVSKENAKKIVGQVFKVASQYLVSQNIPPAIFPKDRGL